MASSPAEPGLRVGSFTKDCVLPVAVRWCHPPHLFCTMQTCTPLTRWHSHCRRTLSGLTAWLDTRFLEKQWQTWQSLDCGLPFMTCSASSVSKCIHVCESDPQRLKASRCQAPAVTWVPGGRQWPWGCVLKAGSLESRGGSEEGGYMRSEVVCRVQGREDPGGGRCETG